MKKYILAAALVLASASAFADREVSTTGTSSNGRVEACKTAKDKALVQRNFDEEIKWFSNCSCEEREAYNSHHLIYTCSVDARIGKR